MPVVKPARSGQGAACQTRVKSKEKRRKMRSKAASSLILAASALAWSPSALAASPWSATLYAGPASTKFVTQILGGDFEVNGGMVGLAVDRGLFKLGSGISIGAELQLTQFFGSYTYNTGALGVGIRFDEFPWSDSLPTTFAIYTGPSYAPNARIIKDPVPHQDPKFLNFVSVEAGVGLSRKWDAVFRIYHRSGAWGVYSNTADVGTMIGIGLRRRF